jgi:L,D-transpeptidase catalytic domain
MRRSVAILCAVLLWAGSTGAEPFWGAKTSQPAGTDPAALKPGEFVWEGEAAPAGPIVVVVSLAEQRAYVYRNGIRIGVTTTSTGKPGHRTPTGIFVVLQKDKEHHSKTYNDAAMPYTERLTWDGVALHAGGLPGYPSSHGCVHLPSEFARLLFESSHMGMTVVIADEHKAPEDVVHPAVIAPVDVATGKEDEEPRLGASEDHRWEPEKSPTGPVSIVMSAADRRVVVFRNGKEIGRSKIEVRNPETPLGTHAFVMLAGTGDAGGSSAPKPHWIAVGIPGHAGEDKRPLDPAQADRVSLSPEFRKAVYGILSPGATLLVTDASILGETTGVPLNILNADAPQPG